MKTKSTILYETHKLNKSLPDAKHQKSQQSWEPSPCHAKQSRRMLPTSDEILKHYS